MTKGAPLGHLFLYAVPLLLGNWLQLAYNAVDSIIAGRFIGQDALAAEGVAGPVMNLVILAISGLCIGAGVLMSEAFGAKRTARLKETLATTLLFGAALCCAAAALGCALTPWILRALAVPDSIFGITGIYLRITFLGAPFTFFYNALAAGLKSVGDSKTPLKFLAFSAVLNAVLDLILIGGLGFGIVCSAVTTVVAEAASALLAAVYMARRVPELCPGQGAVAHPPRPAGADFALRRGDGGAAGRAADLQGAHSGAGQRAGGRGYRGLQRGHAGGRFCLHAGAEHLPRPLRPTLPRTAAPGRPPASAAALRWACGWSWAIGC